MAYGYAPNTPSYGYQRFARGVTRGVRAATPYYRAATLGAGGEPKNQAPFTNLAGGEAPTRPGTVARAAGATTQPTGYGGKSPDARDGSSESYPNQPAGGNGAGGQGTPGVALPIAYDFRTDPVLQDIMAQGVTTRQDAETGALNAKKHIALQFADETLGNMLGDTATAQAAKANPYGLFNRLNTQQGLDTKNLDEQYNGQNLFYSGARELGQGQLADQYGQQRADLTGQEQQALGGIESNRLAQILAANQAETAGKQNAVDRLLAIAAQNGWSVTGWNADGTPIINDGSGGGAGGGTASAGNTDGGETTTTPPPSGGPANSGYSAGLSADALAQILANAAKRKQDSLTWAGAGA